MNNIDPSLNGAVTGRVPDVAGLIPTSLGHALFPASGKPMWAPTCCRKSAQTSGWSSSRAIWITPSGAAAGYGSVASTGAGARWYSCWSQHRAPNDGAKRDCDQRRPGPTGGIMLKSATGATLIVNDTGIYIQNGKGAMVTLLGTCGHNQ